MKHGEIEKIINRLEIADEELESNKDVALFQVIKSIKELTELVRDKDPDRFGIKQVTAIHKPDINISILNVCHICGSNRCFSDHK